MSNHQFGEFFYTKSKNKARKGVVMNKNYTFGVMQGRLLPKYNGRYQAHPVGTWQQEFYIAQQLGLNTIEFILDYEDAAKNPLMSKEGLEQIRNISEQTGVAVKTVCADYFMQAPLHTVSKDEIEASIATLRKLIANCSAIGVTDIVIPLVDQSSMKTASSKQEFIENIRPLIPLAERYSINLALETDLAPQEFAGLLASLDSKQITVNYDTGNSASLGYDIRQEFAAYGNRISSIHIKDRIRGGSSVVLGNGNTDFDVFFECLRSCNFNKLFIMQAYRDEEGLNIFKQQLEWIKVKLNHCYAKRGSHHGYSTYSR